jgi:ribosomal protein S18 acetylase RimI-like enzyme
MEDLLIRPMQSSEEARACAEIMTGSEPWITFGRDFASSLAALKRKDREVFVALAGGRVAGFIILIPGGGLPGFIQSLAVSEDLRGRGIGTALVKHAEERLFEDFPNVFLLCTAMNTRALKLYERLGYAVAGDLPDFVARGHTEVLMRKSIGPLNEFKEGF